MTKNNGAPHSPSVEISLPALVSLDLASVNGTAEEVPPRLLRLLRQTAQTSRCTSSEPFYSIRAVASHFNVSPTTVSRIYTHLKDEGVLASVWGSKTFITPAGIDRQLRVRAVVGLPASLTLFRASREYRQFFVLMRDMLWKLGFTTRLLFIEDANAKAPEYAELLLGHGIDILISFFPTPKMQKSSGRLADRGIRVITVTDIPTRRREYPYYISRERAICDGLSHWRRLGITFITVLKGSASDAVERVDIIGKCLRECSMAHSVLNLQEPPVVKSWRALMRRPDHGTIIPSAELAIHLASQDPPGFSKTFLKSKLMLVEGQLDAPTGTPLTATADVTDVDWDAVSKRIVRDLVNPTKSASSEPPVFHAKFHPANQ